MIEVEKAAVFDEMTNAIATKLADSNILSIQVAERFKRDESLRAEVMSLVDPDKLAKAIAQEIAFQMDTNIRYRNERLKAVYTSIMKQAESIAAQMIAEKMANDLHHA